MSEPLGRRSLRARLWQGWFALALFILTLIVGNFFPPHGQAMGRGDIGLDFIAFYRAGDLIRRGRTAEFYDLQATRSYDQVLAKTAGLDLGDNYGPLYYPPFYAWIFVPLAGLAFHRAVCVWIVLGLGCFAAAAVLLTRMIPSRDWRDWALPTALMTVSLPFLQVIGHGQNTFLSLLLAATVVTAWRSRRGFWAGLAAGLLVYKPQLAAVILVVLVLDLGWRAMAGAMLSVGGLVLVTVVSLPGTLTIYLHQLAPNVQQTLAYHPLVWQRHVTIRAFWQILLMGRSTGHTAAMVSTLSLICAAPLGVWLAVCLWRDWKLNRTEARPVSRDRLIAATIAVMPLLMPYCVDYDLLLLALPATLFAAEIIGRGRQLARDERLLIGLWVILFVFLMVPSLTRYLQFSLIVPCLATIAAMLLARAGRLPGSGIEAAPARRFSPTAVCAVA